MIRKMTYGEIYEAFSRFRDAEAEPLGELHHTNAYTLTVAVALSAQATDKGVNRATEKLFQVADTPEKMIALGEEGLIEHIKTIGLFRNKAKNVMKMAHILVDEFGGEVPSSREALQSLPGVGRKIAAGVMNASTLDRRAIVLDGHHTRILQRMGLIPPKANTARAFAAIMPAMPEEWSGADYDEHHLLMKKLGQTWCRPAAPACPECPAQALCETGRHRA